MCTKMAQGAVYGIFGTGYDFENSRCTFEDGSVDLLASQTLWAA